jgi:putative ATPase
MKHKKQPLADLLRPKEFEDVIGQEHLFKENSTLSLIAISKNIPSMILWGPPGVGKTTIAKALAHVIEAEFIAISAINSGVADIRKIIDNARKFSAKTVLMIDEIHHFNKTQQDLFLPFIEDGTIILIGTTTENPSFHLNSALLSRCKVLTLKALDEDDLEKILQRAEKILDKKLLLTTQARKALLQIACGDARYLLNACEELFSLTKEIDVEALQSLISKRAAHFDKKGDFHYNLISAFHKALRGSDVDAGLYYLARMLEAKENPYFILRRLAKFATEDIGMADPQAVLQVMAAKDIYDFLGSPDGDYAISYATIYCATAPKSNAAYVAHNEMMEVARGTTHLNPPKNILNAPTKMMKEQGYSKGYIYDHDTPNCFSGQEFFPEELLKKSRPKFYRPNERGFERDIKKRLEYWGNLKDSKKT